MIWIVFSRSVRRDRSEAVVLWWAMWLVLLLLSSGVRRRRRFQGQRSMGSVPGRRAGTRLQSSPAGTRLICGPQSLCGDGAPSLGLQPAALPCSGDGGARAGWLIVEDAQGSRVLSVFSCFFRVLCARWWDSCPVRCAVAVCVSVLVFVRCMLVFE